jgi:hypothetical protein
MRALVITAALLGTAMLLSGCPRDKPEPVPGPQSCAATNTARCSGLLLPTLARAVRPPRGCYNPPRLGL